jgi:hypothetical protein
MKEELTTLMHSEFLEGEVERDDLLVMAAYSQVMRKGISIEEACKNNGISVKYFKENVDRVMS